MLSNLLPLFLLSLLPLTHSGGAQPPAPHPQGSSQPIDRPINPDNVVFCGVNSDPPNKILPPSISASCWRLLKYVLNNPQAPNLWQPGHRYPLFLHMTAPNGEGCEFTANAPVRRQPGGGPYNGPAITSQPSKELLTVVNQLMKYGLRQVMNDCVLNKRLGGHFMLSRDMCGERVSLGVSVEMQSNRRFGRVLQIDDTPLNEKGGAQGTQSSQVGPSGDDSQPGTSRQGGQPGQHSALASGGHTGQDELTTLLAILNLPLTFPTHNSGAPVQIPHPQGRPPISLDVPVCSDHLPPSTSASCTQIWKYLLGPYVSSLYYPSGPHPLYLHYAPPNSDDGCEFAIPAPVRRARNGGSIITSPPSGELTHGINSLMGDALRQVVHSCVTLGPEKGGMLVMQREWDDEIVSIGVLVQRQYQRTDGRVEKAWPFGIT